MGQFTLKESEKSQIFHCALCVHILITSSEKIAIKLHIGIYFEFWANASFISWKYFDETDWLLHGH